MENTFANLNDLLKGLAGATNTNREWWSTFRYPETPNFTFDKLLNCARSALFGEALASDKVVYETLPVSKVIPFLIPNQVFIEIIENKLMSFTKNLNARLVYYLQSKPEEINFFFILSGGAILVKLFTPSEDIGNCLTMEVSVVSTDKNNKKLANDLLKFCSELPEDVK